MDVISEQIKGETGVPAFIFRPRAKGSYPCVVLLHERYGLVKHTTDLAERLADSGYVVITPDLFYSYPDQESLRRGEVGVRLTDAEVVDQIDDVRSVLSKVECCDPDRFAVMGVCQSGRYSIVYGAKRPVSSCITFYGAAQVSDWEVNEYQPEGLGALIKDMSAPILGVFGEKDHVISISDVENLRDNLEKSRKSYRIIVYPDAPHGWLNDTMPGRYRPGLAAMAWSELLAFLAESLNGNGSWSKVRWEFRSVTSQDYDFSSNVRLE